MTYFCPMHPDVILEKPGRCPICGMTLVEKGKQLSNSNHDQNIQNSYMPLVIIISLILLVAIVFSLKDASVGTVTFTHLLSYFMIGFFLIFSGFKLLDLKGFAQGYSTYDLLAKRIFAYGYVYPFIELFFGLLMILAPTLRFLLVAEVVVMSFSGLGVLIKLLRHERFQCACLGTFLKVPLTKVTLIEDFGMAALALLLLFLT